MVHTYPQPLEVPLEERWHTFSKEEIILKFSSLVKYVAGRIALKLPSSVEVEDLYQSGILGLIDAVDKFDPSRGIKFQTYAEFRIRGAILDELRAQDWVPRSVRHAASVIEGAYLELEGRLGRAAEDVEVATHLGITLTELYGHLDAVRGIAIVSFDELRPSMDEDDRDILEVLADPTVEDPLEVLGLKEVRAALGQAIDGLPEKERLVVTLYYIEELTMQEIGALLGLTESRISQLHSKAALRMRARVRKVLRGGY